MRETRIIMGMPVTVDARTGQDFLNEVFDYFVYIDEKFSTYKSASEISAINAGRLKPEECSEDMREIFRLSEKTKKETGGYFDIVNREGKYDPSGIVKGWAIRNAADILRRHGVKDFFIDAGGDVEISGKNEKGEPWSVGIADPFAKNYGGTVATGAPSKVVKVIRASDDAGTSASIGIATSGTGIRGQHIYNPHKKSAAQNNAGNADDGIDDIVSLTVIGPDIYEADRFATAAFAMGKKGIEFIENLRFNNAAGAHKLEGYMVDRDGMATMTSGFEKYTL